MKLIFKFVTYLTISSALANETKPTLEDSPEIKPTLEDSPPDNAIKTVSNEVDTIPSEGSNVSMTVYYS